MLLVSHFRADILITRMPVHVTKDRCYAKDFNSVNTYVLKSCVFFTQLRVLVGYYQGTAGSGRSSLVYCHGLWVRLEPDMQG